MNQLKPGQSQNRPNLIKTKNKIIMKNKSYLGKEIHFDAVGHSIILTAWEGKLLPAINKIAEAYNALLLGAFTQEVYDEIIESGSDVIEKRYDSAIGLDLKLIGKHYKSLGSLLTKPTNETEAKINFRNACKVFLTIKQNLEGNILSNYSKIDFTDCKIIDGIATVNKDNINSRFVTGIDTKEKEEFYVLLLNSIEAFNSLRQFTDKYKANNFGHNFNILSVEGVEGLNNGFIKENASGKMELVPDNFNFLFQ